MLEKLPTPFGLSRYGVAPDHSEVKTCEEVLESLAQEGNVKVYTGVEVGKDVNIQELRECFDSIVFAYGTDQEVRLGVPGEDEGHSRNLVLTSREFVDWYNGNPLWNPHKGLDLSQIEDVTIIGNGNVAMDIARLLLTPVSQLHSTDIMNRAVAGLKRSNVKRVNIVGRRGLLESAFATKEVRELIQLEQHGVKFEGIQGQDLGLIKGVVAKADRVLKRKMETLFNALKPLSERKLKYKVSETFNKFWNLQYLRSLTHFDFNDQNKIQIELTHNELQLQTPASPAKTHATSTKSHHITDLVITSLGYKSTPLPDFPEEDISFSNGHIHTKNYKVLNSKTHQPITGLYATGWITRESKGAILNQVSSGMSLAQIIIDDLRKGTSLGPSKREFEAEGWKSWKDWEKLDLKEKERGKLAGKERWKFESLKEMEDELAN